jgi:carbon monoxide dehydrogenase subunit G
MKFTGQHTLAAPVEQVWDALLDPAVLVRTIPGCERLEALPPSGPGDHAYAMTVTAGVAAINGTYAGSCVLSDLQPHQSLVMKLDGAGAPGTIGATVDVRFAAADGGTAVAYDADAIVGGMIGGVGQRMLSSVSKRMAGEFFGNVERAIAGTLPAAPTTAAVTAEQPAEVGAVFTAPPKPSPLAGVGSPDFVKGLAVGAGLVLAGVIVGGLFGRRR